MARVLLMYGCIEGHKTTVADAVRAYVQSMLKSKHRTYIRIPRELWPEGWSEKGYSTDQTVLPGSSSIPPLVDPIWHVITDPIYPYPYRVVITTLVAEQLDTYPDLLYVSDMPWPGSRPMRVEDVAFADSAATRKDSTCKCNILTPYWPRLGPWHIGYVSYVGIGIQLLRH